MKIGELAKLSGVSKDSIRYYVENGLLFPAQHGAQMDFSDRELEDLLYIKRLRKTRFSIREIKFLQSLRHTNNMLEPDIIKEYQDMIDQKQRVLDLEIEELMESKELLRKERENLLPYGQQAACLLGIPLSALPLIVCPICGRQMDVENARIIGSGYVYSGEMVCGCGHRIAIEDGILVTENRYLGDADHPDYRHGGIVQNVGDNFYNCFQKCYDSIMNNIKGDSLKGKVVMESQVNGYFFLYNHFRELSNECLYIVIDKFPETLKMYKALIEQLGLRLNILFIADNSTSYPLREACVDTLISFFGDNEYLLYHEDFFIRDAKKFMKKNTEVLGATMSYPPQSVSRGLLPKKYPECSAKTHDVRELKNAYENEGYCFECQEVGSMTKTCNEFSYECHQDGEALTMYYFKAKKSG